MNSKRFRYNCNFYKKMNQNNIIDGFCARVLLACDWAACIIDFSMPIFFFGMGSANNNNINLYETRIQWILIDSTTLEW